jgi:hypothetical protein
VFYPENIQEQFNGDLRAWKSQNDVLGGLYLGIQSLAHYQSQFLAHILSLNVTNKHDMYTISGLNCSATPISITIEVTGSGSVQVVLVLFNRLIMQQHLMVTYSKHLIGE